MAAKLRGEDGNLWLYEKKQMLFPNKVTFQMGEKGLRHSVRLEFRMIFNVSSPYVRVVRYYWANALETSIIGILFNTAVVNPRKRQPR